MMLLCYTLSDHDDIILEPENHQSAQQTMYGVMHQHMLDFASLVYSFHSLCAHSVGDLKHLVYVWYF